MSKQVELTAQEFAQYVSDNLTRLVDAANSLYAECERMRGRLEVLESMHGIDATEHGHAAITKAEPAAEDSTENE